MQKLEGEPRNSARKPRGSSKAVREATSTLIAPQEKVPKSEVQKAMQGVNRAISRLVALLGHEDVKVIPEAALALYNLGPAAAGPLAAALQRHLPLMHRGLILLTLSHLGSMAPVVASEAFLRVLRFDRDPWMRECARMYLGRIASEEVRKDEAKLQNSRQEEGLLPGRELPPLPGSVPWHRE